MAAVAPSAVTAYPSGDGGPSVRRIVPVDGEAHSFPKDFRERIAAMLSHLVLARARLGSAPNLHAAAGFSCWLGALRRRWGW